MKDNIILIGAGGLGREVYNWFSSDIHFKGNLLGFLDIAETDLSQYNVDLKYLGNENDYKFRDNDKVVITIADINIRRRLYDNLVGKVQFINLIHSTAIIAKDVKIGTGNIFCPNTIISNNVTIGCNNFFNFNTSVSHDSKLSDNIVMSPNSLINGQCSIESNVLIGANSTIFENTSLESNTLIEANTLVKGKISKNVYVCGVPGRIFPRK